MYTLKVPFKDYRGLKRTQEVSFNLDAREVFKMLPQLKSVFEWLESNETTEPRNLTTEEVTEFYNDFEEILLAAWGEMSEDGLYFKKAGKYEFEESALFNACMVMFVTEPEKTGKLINGIMPPELFEMVQKADSSDISAVAEANASSQALEIEKLRAQLAAKDAQN